VGSKEESGIGAGCPIQGLMSSSQPQDDPFTGVWKFSPQWSALSTPQPRSWIQRIRATADEVSVREEIVGSDGVGITVTVQARFDGKAYPVNGSLIADTIVYSRPDTHNISSIGKKDGVLSLQETLTASPQGHILTLSYKAYSGFREVAKGTAVFEKADQR
jgi:hypothetical protein